MTEPEVIKFHIEAAVNEGIAIGLRQCGVALNQFLDTKLERGLSESIDRTELNIFLGAYIKEWESSKKCH